MYKIKKKETLANTIKKVLAGIIKLSWPTEKTLTPQLRIVEAQEELQTIVKDLVFSMFISSSVTS